MRSRIIKILIVTIPVLMIVQDLKSQSSGTFAIDHLSGISSRSSEIAPVFTGDGILFCSNRKTNPFYTKKNKQGIRLFELWYSPVGSDGMPGKAVRFAPGLADDSNVGPACLSPDGKTLYFTRNYLPGKEAGKKEINRLGIFTAVRNGNQWTDIRPFEYNDQGANISYPFVTADGRYMFFSSDMQGGQGKYDIYRCENINGRWSKPVNLGPQVNSAAAEIHPFLHSSGRLYFTSDRPGGLGGLDNWYSSEKNGTWTRPVRMEEPVNSTADDFAFYAIQGGMEGYFSSNRENASDDIYHFASTIIRWSACDTLKSNSYCFEFIEETALLTDTLDLKSEWVWNFGDGSSARGITSEHCFAGPGVYDVSLDIVNMVTGAVEKRQASYELAITDIEQPVIAAPDTALTGSDVMMNARDTYLPGMKIARYYWNFGDETVAEGLEVRKSFSLPGTYNMQLIVTSLPDASGVIREVCVCRDIEVVEKGN